MKLILALAAALFLPAAPALAQHDHPATHTLGALTIAAPFSRATLPNAPVAGGFFTVSNTGPEDDRLVAATSDVAGRIEIHEMAMEGDVMKMRELADGLPIPAGETVELKPGGYHVMFMDLAQPLVEGESVEVTLTFERAGEITIPLQVGPPNARGGGHGGMKHGASGHLLAPANPEKAEAGAGLPHRTLARLDALGAPVRSE